MSQLPIHFFSCPAHSLCLVSETIVLELKHLHALVGGGVRLMQHDLSPAVEIGKHHGMAAVALEDHSLKGIFAEYVGRGALGNAVAAFRKS